jgi:hypothetical protein
LTVSCTYFENKPITEIYIYTHTHNDKIQRHCIESFGNSTIKEKCIANCRTENAKISRSSLLRRISISVVEEVKHVISRKKAKRDGSLSKPNERQRTTANQKSRQRLSRSVPVSIDEASREFRRRRRSARCECRSPAIPAGAKKNQNSASQQKEHRSLFYLTTLDVQQTLLQLDDLLYKFERTTIKHSQANKHDANKRTGCIRTGLEERVAGRQHTARQLIIDQPREYNSNHKQIVVDNTNRIIFGSTLQRCSHHNTTRKHRNNNDDEMDLFHESHTDIGRNRIGSQLQITHNALQQTRTTTITYFHQIQHKQTNRAHSTCPSNVSTL